METVAYYAKFVAAMIGAFATAFAELLPPEVSPWVQAVTAFLTAAAVILVPNGPKPGSVDGRHEA